MGELLEYIHPFIEIAFELVFLFGKIGHFEIDIGQLIVENAALLIFKLNFMAYLLVRIFIGEGKIEDADEVNSSQLIVPVAFLSLLLNREGRIEETSVFEEILFGLLHFDDEALAIFAYAIEVEYGLTVSFRIAEVFVSGVAEVFDMMFAGQDLVEEIDEYILVGLGAEQFFETEIGEGIDVFILERHWRTFIGQIYTILGE